MEPLTTVARMRLTAQLTGLVRDVTAIVPGSPMASMKKAKIGKQIVDLLGRLGIDLNAKAREAAAFELEDGPEPVEVPRAPSAKFYDFDPNRKHSQRKKDNEAAMGLLARIDAGELDAERLTPEQKATLARYSGTGGALVGADGKTGSAYEYYTPKPIAEAMWNLMADLGFTGGKVLDPSGGTGIFGATATLNAVVDAVELNETAGRINALVNAGPGYSVEVSNFESVASRTPDEIYDAVATNVPFGKVSARGANLLDDPRYQKEPLESYFLLRSLEKLKPGGLGIYITPPRCVSERGGAMESLRMRMSMMAEFMGAYRLPNSVFGTADADTITDVIVLRKFGRDAALKIAELKESAPAKLVESKVMWSEFIGGKYFTGEGKRFVLGEFVPKNPEDFRPVDRVLSKNTVPEIARMLRKFPGSRIDWAMIEAAETAPIVYAEGDTLTQKGQTLKMTNGEWVPVKSNEASKAMIEVGGKLTDPMTAFKAGVTWPDAEQYVRYMIDSSQSLDVPGWLQDTVSNLQNLQDHGDRATYWRAGVVGQCVKIVADSGAPEGTSYQAMYPELSAAMERVAGDAKSCPAVVGGVTKSGLQALGTHYSRKAGFSGVWAGRVAGDGRDTRSAVQKFEGVKYAAQGIWVDRATADKLYEGENFDPIADPAWCLSDDGKTVARADDYFVGNYGDMIARLDAAAKKATDPVLRGKLLAQRAEAEKRVDRIDVSRVGFNLFSPYVTDEEKADFLRRFVDPSFQVTYHEVTGKPVIKFTEPDGYSEGAALRRKKLMRRFAWYLEHGTVTLATAEVGDRRSAIEALRTLITEKNEQFNAWAKSNQVITGRLASAANDPARLYFSATSDPDPIEVPGLTGKPTPKGYQNAFVRRMGRSFGGINGFGTGLGKTLTALASVAHVHSIGAKKKTVFVAPNSVLSNWKKEATVAYTSLDDCLFVGLTVNKKGQEKTNSSDYDRDLNIIRENRHRKIFMTMEAFQRIRLREETIDRYEAYLRSVDVSFAESEDKKADDVAEGKTKKLTALLQKGKSGAAPFLEDLGIDSVVFDEAHALKNSASTVSFKTAKYLALPASALRGVDAQAKAWYIRGLSPLKDGVLLLTATPITNSPLEIYSMLSLAVGRDRVNDMALGVRGADEFMEVVTLVESEEDETVDGIVRDTRIFKGLENVGVLRNAIRSVAVIEDAQSVGEQVKVPDADEVATNVALPDPPTMETLLQYKAAFRYAIDELTNKPINRGDPAAFEAVSAKFGEPTELIGHPFNLINKMTMLIMDPELDQRATFYQVSKGQADTADRVVAAFNAKKFTEERPRPGPHTAPEAVAGVVKKKVDGETVELLKIQVLAKRIGGKIIIDTMQPATQSAFEVLAEKEKLELDVTVPPKLAALIENVVAEESNPRGIDSEGKPTPRVKQLIFCDILPLHNKIKRLLTRRAGIPAAAIAIITGQQNNSPDEIMEVQDGFNADGEDNKYRMVIANEKAEVGINLQRGTQAIHHLTIGWTPDSLTQRNGRGVRQGNKTERVTVYTYDADGTFDAHKRAMVSAKAEWIGHVMDVNGGDSVAVEGGMSNEKMEILADSIGNSDGMARMQELIAEREREGRAAGVRGKQAVNISTMQEVAKFQQDFREPVKWAERQFGDFYRLSMQLRTVERQLANPKLSAQSLVQRQNQKAELETRVNALRRKLTDGLTFKLRGAPAKLDDILEQAISDVSRAPKNANQIETAQKAFRYNATVNPDSMLMNEWQSEMDSAQLMARESRASFEKYAQQDGGMPVAVIDKFENGDGVMLDGKPVVSGAFVRTKEGLGVVFGGGLSAAFWDRTGYYRQFKVADLQRGFEIILPGSAAYSPAIVEAAAIDDEIAAAGETYSGESYALSFSELVPEVSQRRTNVSRRRYSTDHHGLAAPYFPRVVDPADAAVGDVMAAIVAQQRAVVLEYKAAKRWGVATFVVAAKTDTVPVKYDNTPAAFVAFARANGLRMNLREAQKMIGLGYQLRELLSVNNGTSIESVLTGKTEQELNAAAARWVMAQLPDVIMTEQQARAVFLPNEVAALQSAIAGLMIAKVADVQNALVAAKTPAKPAEPEAKPGDEWIGIAGNTKLWKEQIKAVSTDVGDGWAWDGKAIQWNVQVKSWEALGKLFPDAVVPGQLHTVKFSGKYPTTGKK